MTHHTNQPLLSKLARLKSLWDAISLPQARMHRAEHGTARHGTARHGWVGQDSKTEQARQGRKEKAEQARQDRSGQGKRVRA